MGFRENGENPKKKIYSCLQRNWVVGGKIRKVGREIFSKAFRG